jgi:Fe2+ transport system protein FeoA
MFAPIYEQASHGHNDVVFAKVNTDVEQELAEHDGELLHWFYEHGFEPGREVEVRSVSPAAAEITISLEGIERDIGEKAAAGLFVRKHG